MPSYSSGPLGTILQTFDTSSIIASLPAVEGLASQSKVAAGKTGVVSVPLIELEPLQTWPGCFRKHRDFSQALGPRQDAAVYSHTAAIIPVPVPSMHTTAWLSHMYLDEDSDSSRGGRPLLPILQAHRESRAGRLAYGHQFCLGDLEHNAAQTLRPHFATGDRSGGGWCPTTGGWTAGERG